MKKIVIDAGHGGTDPGATANGIIEKDLTLKISNEMARKLRNLGLEVYQTREIDETLSPSERTKKILGAFGNNEDVIVISNHINAGGADGAEVIYALRNNDKLSNLILDELSKKGQNIRKAYQRRLPSDSSKDYYFIHRETGVTEPVIIEYGFLDSTNDDVMQLKNNYIDYADAVVNALAQYIGISNLDDENTYIVKKGDSLWSIANKYNISVENLKNANSLTSNILSIGQKLIIPTLEENGEYKAYIVKKGDSLYKIAGENNISVVDLMEYNNLTSNNLSVGQMILIPIIKKEEIDVNYLTYTVEKGDNLYSISKKYNVSIADIKDLNKLETSLLSIGQVLKIPTDNITKNEETSSYIEYSVEKGDTLYKIANKYNVSLTDIINYNNLDTNVLSIGQVLKIPIYTDDTVYIVKKGDTLYKLALDNNTTVSNIKNKNNLTTDNLSIGQKLII